MKTIPCPIKAAGRSALGTHFVILHRTHKISYTVYDQLIDAAVKKLQSRGVKRGDIAAIHSPNNLEYVILLPALWRLGAISCHLNTRTPMPVLLKTIKKLRCRFLITGVIPAKEGIQFLNSRLKHSGMTKIRKISLSEIISMTSLGRNDLCTFSLQQKTTILFTSGSTGEPKAVTHTYGNHYYSAKGSNDNIPLKPGDRWLLTLPLYHVSGLGILFRTTLAGASVVIPGEKEELAAALRKYRITHVSLVTTQLHRLLQNRKNIPTLRKLKAILLGGGPIAPNLLAIAKKHRLPVYISYGLTEMASQVATSPRPGAGAKVLNYRRVKIMKGEIRVGGKTLGCGQKNWFATGDLGRLDRDGTLTVIGRKDNMFISGGENIYPEEIEKQLLALPGIESAVVVPQSDREFGQRPVAFIKGNIKPAQIACQLEKTLPRFKIPQKFYAWPDELLQGLKPQRKIFLKLIK